MAFDEKNKDDFWDVDKLVPRKKGALSPFASHDPTTEVDIPSGTADDNAPAPRNEEERRLNILSTARSSGGSEIIETYCPEGYSLIKSITSRHYVDRYDFYDNFRKSALIYYDYKTNKCDFAQFYSYMPQYSQLNSQQRNYYFYWRGELRRGKYIRTDYSYVYLYVYEIINLPDKIPADEGLKLLCRVWKAYRHELPRLDNYFSIWVQDYCMVHKLACPMSLLEDFIFDVVTATSFKEFYLSEINSAGSGGVAAVLAYLSDYDWRKGKFVQGNPDDTEDKRKASAITYKQHMEGAMSLLLHDLWGELIEQGRRGKTAVVKRDAFTNSLCTHMVKRRLEIEYYPIAEAEGLRRGITAAVRYTENKLRALMGVKSRLAVKDIPNEYRRIIDLYFEALFDRERKIRERENAPAYERLYDAPEGEMSFEGADEIERASWDTTMRLVEASEDEDNTDAPDTANLPEPESADIADVTPDTLESSADCYGLGITELSYIASLLGIKYMGRDYAPDPSVPEETLVERINEAFADNFGDVIIEPSDEGFTIIEDYREDITEWLSKITR